MKADEGDAVPKLSDEELVDLVRESDTEAYVEVVVRYQQKLYRYLKYLTGETGAAEDLVQDVFIKAYRNLFGFDTRRSFSSWIYRIAHNEGVNYLKKSRRHRVTSLDALGTSPAAKEPSSYDELHRRQLQQMLHECLDELEARYRGPLALYYFEDKTYRDISEILRVPTGTVGTLISRGKKRLRIICEERMRQDG